MSNVMYLSITFLEMEAKQFVVQWTFSSAIFNSIRDARSSVLRSFHSTWLSLFFRTYTSEFGICLFSTPLILITAGKWSEICYDNIGFNFFAMYIWVNMTRTTGLPACSSFHNSSCAIYNEIYICVPVEWTTKRIWTCDYHVVENLFWAEYGTFIFGP